MDRWNLHQRMGRSVPHHVASFDSLLFALSPSSYNPFKDSKQQLNMSAESSASGSGHRALRRSNRTTPTSTTTPAVEVRRPYDHSSAGLRLVSSDGKIFYVDLEIVRAAG